MIDIPTVVAEMSARERKWLAFQRLAAESTGDGCIDQWTFTGYCPPWLKTWRMVETRKRDDATRLTFFGALVANEILKTEWPTGFLKSSYFDEPRTTQGGRHPNTAPIQERFSWSSLTTSLSAS